MYMTYSEGKMLTLQHFYFFLLHTLQVTIQNTVLRVKGKKMARKPKRNREAYKKVVSSRNTAVNKQVL